jgi:hypothetical protein
MKTRKNSYKIQTQNLKKSKPRDQYKQKNQQGSKEFWNHKEVSKKENMLIHLEARILLCKMI